MSICISLPYFSRHTLHSSKAKKLLNLMCPIVLLFTSFTLPSIDKFAEKNVQLLPQTLRLSTFYIFFLRILVKTFYRERKPPGVLNVVLIIPFTFPMIKYVPFFALFFSPPFPFFHLPLIIFNLLLLLFIPILKMPLLTTTLHMLNVYSINPESCCSSSLLTVNLRKLFNSHHPKCTTSHQTCASSANSTGCVSFSVHTHSRQLYY
jgi:hypothetical protein